MNNNYSKIYKITRKYLSLFFRLLPIKKNKIIFDNMLGKGYGDNPKYIADEIIKNGLKYDIVWVVKDLNSDFPKEIRKVKYASIKAMYEYMTAKIWIDNVRNTIRPRKRNGQYYLQLWHGSVGFKMVESDAKDGLNENYIKRVKRDGKEIDAILSSTQNQTELFKKSFWLGENVEILKYGVPRNDYIINNKGNKDIIKTVRCNLKIPDDAFTILYAPTFRDNYSTQGYLKDSKAVLKAFENSTKRNCVLVIRMHPNASFQRGFYKYDENVIDGCDYPDMQKLAIASDCIITDYSSAFFDFLLQRKPVFLFSPDFEEYQKTRGIKSDYKTLPFSMAFSEDEFLKNISEINFNEYSDKISKYLKIFPVYDTGDSNEKIIQWIEDKMNK